ncbi:hypothetical protein SAMN04487944_10229 [Gracilibacillus ureilyticus]|uniref:Integral inner membrane protein n=1 Tax=Gracilibacillus ureilyticus TaxID=531814 RepID=A0A1H9MKB3_9BACI|nr:hypothetical protein [Gracilibacillus ureilyticus]SER24126.1 hypothetical protein SAMN04487944_10229 [Gracilibacillus ureilyticus]
MFKRFFMVFLTLILAIAALLLAAQYPTGPNTVSFDEPVPLLLSAGMLVLLFLPPLILSFFNNMVVKIISAIYQGFIVLSFLILIPIGLIIPSFWIIANAVAGAVVSISSIIVTILVGLKKRNPAVN